MTFISEYQCFDSSCCFTHSFEGFLQVLVGGLADCIAVIGFLGRFARRGLLALRLGRRRDLLLVLFLRHLVDALEPRLGHLQGH